MSIPEQRLAGTGDEIGPASGASSRIPTAEECVTQLRAFAREHLRGGCKILSQGASCRCNLCAVDDLWGELCDVTARNLTVEKSYAALQVEHATTLAEWGARIEGLLTERAVYANQVAEMGGLLERVEPLADFAALAKPETLLAADLMGLESMEEAEQCRDEWMEINTAVRDYVSIHVSPLGGGE